jgi:hypothetical protein
MSDSSLLHPLNTSKRGRIEMCGSFTTANTSAPTTPAGDGVAARTGTGTFTVTLPNKPGTLESITPHISGGASTIDATYSAGVITITTYTSGSAADTNALRVNWRATFSTRVNL